MYIRSLLLGLVLLLPIGVFADNSTTASPPATSSASDLGPSTTAGGVSSSADGGVLQPAGISPLQATTQDASGLNPASTDPLQATSGSDQQLKVLLGSESDGQSHSISDQSSHQLFDLVGVGLLLILGGVGYFWRGRLRRHI